VISQILAHRFELAVVDASVFAPIRENYNLHEKDSPIHVQVGGVAFGVLCGDPGSVLGFVLQT
jgi:hypothetical protein